MGRISKRKNTIMSLISVTDAGILITSASPNGDSTIEIINWANIEEVTAYKRDCYGVDLMCLAIGGAQNFEITEEMQGWDELLNRAPDFLPGWRSKIDWYRGVTLPAFNANRTVIFSRR
jgi:hypothetical protein